MNCNRFAILVMSLLVMAGCVSAPKSDWHKTVVKSKTEQLDFPSLQTEITRSLGDTLAEKGYKSSVPAIIFRSDWVMKSETYAVPAFIVPEGKEGELFGIWTNHLTGESVECYAMEYGYPPHWNYMNYGVGYDNPFYLCEQSDGSFTSLQKLDSSLNPSDLPYRTVDANSGVLKKFTKISVSDPSYVQQIIYNGRVGNSLKFIYREFAGDYIRPAFTQEIQYDLSLSNTIGFKSLKLEVLEATNTEIRYRLLENF